VSAKKPDISQIRKYLSGELDARAMHQLEREAQDDPFLMEALEGYEQAGKDQQANLANLQERLAKRIAPKKERSIILWRILPIAACLLIALTIGYWYFTPKPVKQYAAIVKPDKITPPTAVPQQAAPQIVAKQNKVAAKPAKTTIIKQYTPAGQQNNMVAIASPVAAYKTTYKTDTVDYKASDYNVRGKLTADELLKKVPGVVVDANGNATSQGQAITKVRINGKDFMGGDAKAAVKNLPADIVEKIQVVDDYGDQAARAGVKSGQPTKVLDIKMDTSLNLIASNKPVNPPGKIMIRGNPAANNELKEVSIRGYATQTKRDVTGSVASVSSVAPDTTLKQALPGKIAGTPRAITGKVVSKSDGSPLPGVTIRINGLSKGAQTDANGNFSIILPANDAALNVAYVGFESQKIQVGNQDNLKIELAPNNASLSEVVVVGYGAAKTGVVSYEAEHPLTGWTAYNKYLKENATLTGGKAVTIKLTFTVNVDGTLSNIKLIKGSTDELNQRAIKLIENGPKWVGSTDGKPKEIKLSIRFHKP